MVKNRNGNNTKKNMIWNMLGSLSFGFISMIFLVITTRLIGISEAGEFSFSFALACTFFTIGSYSGKVYQLTENDKTIDDSDYIFNRIFTTLVMLVIAILFVTLMHYEKNKFWLIIIFTLFRGIDVLSDTLHAIIQRNNQLYKCGISLLIKTIILSVTFSLVSYYFHNIIFSSLTVLIIEIVFCFFVDFRIAKNFIIFKKFNKNNFNQLLKNGFYAFCFAFLYNYVLNIPKYILEMLGSNERQAVLGIIIMPATFMALIATYLVQPFLNKMVQLIEEKKSKELIALIIKMNVITLLFGLLVIIIASFLGIPVLSFIYNLNLNEEKINLIIIIIASIFYALTNIFSATIISLRRTFAQLIILIVTLIFAFIISYILINKYQLFGASLSFLIYMIVECLLYVVVTLFYIKKDMRIDRD